jgi:MFS family permease
MASPMLQEVFGGKLIGLDQTFDQLNEAQKAQIAAIAAGFTGLLSLCNIAGRLGWASASDRLGRKFTYAIFFILGFLLYALAPWAATIGSKFIFVSFFCIILTMYGGGFSTIPAYLADLFGTHMVGAIHGRLLTAWSTAGVLGPILVNYIREYQLSIGVPRQAAYNQTLYVLAVLLILGLICDLLVRPISDKFFMSDDELKKSASTSNLTNNDKDENDLSDFEDAIEEGKSIDHLAESASHNFTKSPRTSSSLYLCLSWLMVGVPMLWGLYNTLNKALQILN